MSWKSSSIHPGICRNVLEFYFFINVRTRVYVSVLKLLKMAKGIRSLLDTLMQALPQIGNLGLLFFLLFFIFAALGVELFGRLGTHHLQFLRSFETILITYTCIICNLICIATIMLYFTFSHFFLFLFSLY